MASDEPDDPPAAPRIEGPEEGQHVVLLSGLSGGGKTAVAKLIEDVGYTVVDNVPSELLAGLAELAADDRGRFARVAIVLDVRAGDAERAYRAIRGALEGRGLRPQVIFVEARRDVLIRRFSETRHRHPLDPGDGSVAAAIDEERRRLEPVRAEADVVIDTSDLSLRELREAVLAALALPDEGLVVHVMSFGYKFGLPLEADLVFDARLLRNPYYEAELRPQSGLSEAVRSFVLGQPVAPVFLGAIDELLSVALPAYAAEGKTRLTVAIGCTGGFHRSIVLAEAIAARLRSRGLSGVTVSHRDIGRPAAERA